MAFTVTVKGTMIELTRNSDTPGAEAVNNRGDTRWRTQTERADVTRYQGMIQPDVIYFICMQAII